MTNPPPLLWESTSALCCTIVQYLIYYGPLKYYMIILNFCPASILGPYKGEFGVCIKVFKILKLPTTLDQETIS